MEGSGIPPQTSILVSLSPPHAIGQRPLIRCAASTLSRALPGSGDDLRVRDLSLPKRVSETNCWFQRNSCCGGNVPLLTNPLRHPGHWRWAMPLLHGPFLPRPDLAGAPAASAPAPLVAGQRWLSPADRRPARGAPVQSPPPRPPAR